MLDWLQDLLAEPESRPNLPGKVHTGFFDATSAIIAAVASEVLRLNPAGGKRVYVTGHSLGGAMASIGACIMQAAPYAIEIAQVVTFASPKPGDGAFQAAYQKVFPTQIRYENYDDLVPLLPPADDLIRAVANIPLIGDLFKQAENWDYQPVGTLRYIESAEGRLQGDPRPSAADGRAARGGRRRAREGHGRRKLLIVRRRPQLRMRPRLHGRHLPARSVPGSAKRLRARCRQTEKPPGSPRGASQKTCLQACGSNQTAIFFRPGVSRTTKTLGSSGLCDQTSGSHLPDQTASW